MAPPKNPTTRTGVVRRVVVLIELFAIKTGHFGRQALEAKPLVDVQVEGVYVRPQYRRQGLYRELYARVKELAEQEPSVCGFRLYVECENTNAQKTYGSLGMVETEYKLFEELQQGLEYKK